MYCRTCSLNRELSRQTLPSSYSRTLLPHCSRFSLSDIFKIASSFVVPSHLDEPPVPCHCKNNHHTLWVVLETSHTFILYTCRRITVLSARTAQVISIFLQILVFLKVVQKCTRITEVPDRYPQANFEASDLFRGRGAKPWARLAINFYTLVCFCHNDSPACTVSSDEPPRKRLRQMPCPCIACDGKEWDHRIIQSHLTLMDSLQENLTPTTTTSDFEMMKVLLIDNLDLETYLADVSIGCSNPQGEMNLDWMRLYFL